MLNFLFAFSILRLMKKTIANSVAVLRDQKSLQGIAVVDFVMQCFSFLLWDLYLCYTGLRCATLLVQYAFACKAASIENKKTIWRHAQVYACTKFVGIFVSQITLLLVGLSTPLWSLIVCGWGIFLLSLGAFAHVQSRKQVFI